MNITSPYNFIPLNKQVFYPDWADLVSQDLPLKDAHDYYFEFELKNISPLFTRDGKQGDDGKPSKYSAHILSEDGKRHYFIPATTIKGMLREIVEIMSFGKMQEGKDYQNRYFGFRDVARRSNKASNAEYIRKVNMGKPGWLAQEGNRYYFTPCFGELQKIEIAELAKLYPSYQSDPSIWKSNISVGREGNNPSYPEIERKGNNYRIVCTGQIAGKKHELLFPSYEDEPILLQNETIQTFTNMYDSTPGFAEKKDGEGCFLSALESGQRVPVFYLKLEDGKETIGFSRMFKLPYKYNVRQQVEVLQQTDANKRDFAETLFGYAGKDDSLKGRVQVSHAFMEGCVPDNELIETKGVLGTPKASYYPLYLKQRHSQYKTYDNNEGIAGRKLYRIHKGSTTAELPKAENNENVGTCFKALPPSQTFRFCITLHNVKDVEAGAILAALTFNHTPGVYHNLGMAKSFGFGKCKIEKTAGNADDERCLREFEKQMSVFTYENSKQLWAQTESITQLVNILGEHDEEDVKMMKLEEDNKSEEGYKYFKEDKHFDRLKEKGYPINTLLSEEEKEYVKILSLKAKGERAGKEARKALSQQYALAKKHVANGLLEEAKAVYNQITDELLKKGIDLQPENQKIADLEAKIAKQEAAKKEQEQQAAHKAKADKLAAGLAAVLDKLAGDGVNYSIKDFKVCFQKVDRWLKDSQAAQLTEADANDLYSTSVRILKEPSKKEVKDLSKSFGQGCIWKKLATYIGKEKAQALYNSYQK